MMVALWCSWIVTSLACGLSWYCMKELNSWISAQELHEQQDHATIRQWAERAHAAEEELEKLRKEHFIEKCRNWNAAEVMARASGQKEFGE